MLNHPHLRIGIAVACLVAVAVLIARDQWKADDGSPAAGTVTVTVEKTALPAVPPPVVPVAAAPPPTVLCPPVEPEVAKATAAPKPAEPAPALAKPALPEQRVYTVVQGDTLYGISVKVFGTPRHYERIYEANRDRIGDPNTLQIGINLKMPDVPVKPGTGSTTETSTKATQ